MVDRSLREHETTRADKAEAELAAACADLATLRRAASAYRDAVGVFGNGERIGNVRFGVQVELGKLNVALRGERREGLPRRRYSQRRSVVERRGE